MKRKKLLVRWLWSICFALLAQGVSAQASFCDNFTSDVNHWTGSNASASHDIDNTSSNGTGYLRGTDGNDASLIYNATDFIGAALPCGGTLCWKYKVFEDLDATQHINVTPSIRIYIGPIDNPTLFATFTATGITVNETSNWVSICATIGQAVNGALPAGWTMGNNGTVAQWNQLATSFTGVAFNTDINPNPNIGEVIGIDDFCINPGPCCNTNASSLFSVTTACVNGLLNITVSAAAPVSPNNWWGLMQTSQAGVTTDAVTMNNGAPLQLVTGVFTVTFTGLDPTKFYYIKHGIWDPNCYTWRETRTAIALPTANYIIAFPGPGILEFKNDFCYGETISMIAIGNPPAASYNLSLWRRPLNSPANTPFVFYGTLGTINGQPPIFTNLTTAFAALPTPIYFEPNFEYSVRLGIDPVDPCYGYTEVENKLRITCCPDYFNADFLLPVNPSPNSYAISAIGFNTYANVGATHEWYVLSSPNQFGGPYTPVTSLTSTTQTTVPLISNAQYNLFYTVIHKVITKCGEICIKRTQYQSKLGRATDAMALTQSQVDCCLAFQFWPNGAGTPPADFSGKFEVGSTPNGNGTYTINTYLGNAYSNNPNVTHQWYVFSSPNPSGGPYTQVGQGTGANFSFSPADYGLYYFVIHRVISPCGILCYGQSICQNCERAESSACELCGPIDCALLDTLLSGCGTPTNLNVDCNKLALIWNAVPGAVQYAVEVSFNDPACCRSPYLPSGFLWNDVRDPYVLFSSFSTVRWECLRFRVKAKCESGESAWSDWQCVLPCREVAVDGQVIARAKAVNNQLSAALEPRISPNPNNGDMMLSLQAPNDLVLSVEVINAQGSRVTTIPRNTYKGGLFTTKLNLGAKVGKGVYTVVFNTNFGTFRKKVIVQ